MGSDIKSGVGYIIPVSALIGFVISLAAGSYLFSIFFAVAGILVWFLYMMVMETTPPGVMGNIIILFGVLLALAIFMIFGLEQNMFGGFEFRPEGTIFALIVLFFGVMTGILFNRSRDSAEKTLPPVLTDQEKELVQQTLAESEEGKTEPKVIVLKQEAPAKEETDEKKQEFDASEYYSRYGYAYPPEYYDEYEEDEDDEYEDEEEYEEEEE